MAAARPGASLWLPDEEAGSIQGRPEMRSVPFDLVIIYADPDPVAEDREIGRRTGAGALPDDAATGSHRSLAWLTGLARRRPAARARRAIA